MRKGAPLAAWLPQLVAEECADTACGGRGPPGDDVWDSERSYRPGRSRMGLGRGDLGTSGTLQGRGPVRPEGAGLWREAFVRKLILYRMALRDDRRRRVDVADEQDNAPNIYQDRLLRRLQAADGDLSLGRGHSPLPAVALCEHGPQSETRSRRLRWRGSPPPRRG